VFTSVDMFTFYFYFVQWLEFYITLALVFAGFAAAWPETFSSVIVMNTFIHTYMHILGLPPPSPAPGSPPFHSPLPFLSLCLYVNMSICQYQYVNIVMSISICHYQYVNIIVPISICQYHYVDISMSISICQYQYFNCM